MLKNQMREKIELLENRIMQETRITSSLEFSNFWMNDNVVIPRYRAANFYCNNKFGETPFIVDCDNKQKIPQETFFELVQTLIAYLQDTYHLTMYVWKTSSHKEFPGYHLISNEIISWKLSDQIALDLKETWNQVADKNYLNGALGIPMMYDDGTTKHVSKNHSCRVSPRYPTDGSKPIADIECLSDIPEDAALHIQWKKCLVELYSIID